MPTDRRVVITGLGVVTPVGNDLKTFWSNLTSGTSGIGTISAFDPAEYDCRIAGEGRDFQPGAFFKSAKDVRRTDRYTQFAMAAAKMAIEDGQLDPANIADRERFGC